MFVYGTTTVGATVHLHFCMNKFISLNFTETENKTCGKCGMNESASTKIKIRRRLSGSLCARDVISSRPFADFLSTTSGPSSTPFTVLPVMPRIELSDGVVT